MKTRFYYHHHYGFIVLFGKMFWMPTFPKIRRFLSAVRGCFPKAWLASFYCCDLAKFHAGALVFSWNDRHFRRLEKELDRASDGTTIKPIPLMRGIAMQLKGDTKWP